ncbi:MAG: DinB family protein [Acidobacteria bacterium]|nr:DinB family protein [Acidobacteriota bacterium]
MSALHASRKQFLDALAGLSEKQLMWKPSPDSWSIFEIAEHLARAEDQIPALVAKAMQVPAAADRKPPTRAEDEKILKSVAVRDQKFKAPASLVPAGTYMNIGDLIAAFKASRDRNIAYIRDTQDPLRAHVAPHPVLGNLDGLQWYLLIAGHTERHVLQMKEVKEQPGFPKK